MIAEEQFIVKVDISYSFDDETWTDVGIYDPETRRWLTEYEPKKLHGTGTDTYTFTLTARTRVGIWYLEISAMIYDFGEERWIKTDKWELEIFVKAYVKGEQKTIAIFVQFTDVKNSTSVIDVLDRSVKPMMSYWEEVSYNTISVRVWYAFDVWWSLPHTIAYYGADSETATDDPDGDGHSDSWWLIKDAVQAVDEKIDFSKYQHIIVVHAGNDQASSHEANDIRSAAPYGLYISTNDGITVTHGVIVAETSLTGTFAHEFGHSIGLQDLYNVTNRESIVGPWSLMDEGAWLGSPHGSSPAHLEAWSKICLGWISSSQIAIVNPGESKTLLVDPLETSTKGIHTVKIPLTGSTYYLVEVRQKRGFDSYLPDRGVLITYIDEKIPRGYGPVRIEDAKISTPTLDDATFDVGPGENSAFKDLTNQIFVTVLARVNSSYKIEVKYSVPFYIITFDSSPRVPSITVDGVTYTQKQLPLTFNWIQGSTHTISISPIVMGEKGIRYVFTRWSDESIETSRTVMVSKDAIYIAQFKTQFYLIVESPNGDPQGEDWYDKGKIATFSITTPIDHGNETRRVFTGWSGDSTATTITATLTMDSPKTVTANWKTQYHLMVDSYYGAPSGTGWYDSGDKATFTVTTPIDHGNMTRRIFISWSEDSTSKFATASITMDEPKKVKALWKTQYYVNVISPYGDPKGAGWNDKRSVATFSVTSPIDYGNKTRLIFARWSGDSTATDPVSTTVIDSPKTVIADWKKQYFLVVESRYGDPKGEKWYDVGSEATFSIDTLIDLENMTRLIFTDWGGDSTATSPTANIIMDGPKRVAAKWKTQYKLDVTSTYGDPQGSEWYDRGSDATFSITSPLDYGNGTRRVFLGWTGGSTASTKSAAILMDAPYTVIALWKTQQYLTVNANGGTVTGEGWYDMGSEAIARATSPSKVIEGQSRLVFTNWSGDSTSNSTSISFNMDIPHTVTANWKTQFYLTLNAKEGEVDKESHWLDEGSSITVRAISPSKEITNKSRLLFTDWSGAITSTDTSVRITMDTYKTLNANWKTQYYLKVNSQYGDTTGEGWYNEGLTATFSVTSPVGMLIQQVFTAWSGDSSVTTSTATLTMDSPKTVTANWRTDYTQLSIIVGVIVAVIAVTSILMIKRRKK